MWSTKSTVIIRKTAPELMSTRMVGSAGPATADGGCLILSRARVHACVCIPCAFFVTDTGTLEEGRSIEGVSATTSPSVQGVSSVQRLLQQESSGPHSPLCEVLDNPSPPVPTL